jgi:hypothetical protein
MRRRNAQERQAGRGSNVPPATDADREPLERRAAEKRPLQKPKRRPTKVGRLFYFGPVVVG